jgi:O-antigen ligase
VLKNNKFENIEITTRLLINLFFAVNMFFMFLNYTPFTSLKINVMIPMSFTLYILIVVAIIFSNKFFVNRGMLTFIGIFGIFSSYFLLDINISNSLDASYLLFYSISFLMFLLFYLTGSKVLIYPILIISVLLYQLLMLGVFLFRISNLEWNSIGILSFLLSYFSVITYKKCTKKIIKVIAQITLMLNIILILVSHSRTSLLALITVYLCYTFWGLIKKRTTLLTGIVIAISILFVNYYVSLFNTYQGIRLNYMIREYTGKNLFSGRQLLWKDAINEVLYTNNYLMGMGNNTILDSAVKNLGYLHNSFVQIFYNSGIIGLILFVLFLLFVANRFKNRNTIEKRVSFSYFIGIIIMQNFEGFLLHPFPNAISSFGWVILGIISGEIVTKSMMPDKNVSIQKQSLH